MQLNKKSLAVFTAGVLVLGGVVSIGAQTYAQTTGTVSVSPTNVMTKLWNHGFDGMDNDADDNVVLPQGGITEAQARSAITTAYPALTIKHIKLEDNNGTVVYSAKLSDGSEVMVDVHTSLVTVESQDQEGTEHQGHRGDNGKDEKNDKPDVQDGNQKNESNDTETNDGAQGPTDKGEIVKTQSAGTSTQESNDTETNDGVGGPTDATTTKH